jgi:Spy/CpxP family protein refolding chaperone
MARTNTRRLSALVILAGTIIAGPLTAMAQGWHGAGRSEGLFPVRLLRTANLSADQQTQIRQVFANHHAAFRSLFGQLQQAQQNVTGMLLGAGPVASADLQASLQQTSQLRDQLQQERAKVALEIRGILTPDQLAHIAQVGSQLQALGAQRRQLLQPSTP